MPLVTSILKKFLYGRVGGVSRGEYAYPGIQITGRLCYFFWKLPIFSFRQLLFLLFCYINFGIKFHIHTFVWMETSPIDYWHFQTLCRLRIGSHLRFSFLDNRHLCSLYFETHIYVPMSLSLLLIVEVKFNEYSLTPIFESWDMIDK